MESATVPRPASNRQVALIGFGELGAKVPFGKNLRDFPITSTRPVLKDDHVIDVFFKPYMALQALADISNGGPAKPRDIFVPESLNYRNVDFYLIVTFRSHCEPATWTDHLKTILTIGILPLKSNCHLWSSFIVLDTQFRDRGVTNIRSDYVQLIGWRWETPPICIGENRDGEPAAVPCAAEEDSIARALPSLQKQL